MASIEQTFIDSSPLTPLFYMRFIDDIFMIWTHGSEELEQFTTRANSSHPSIKFKIKFKNRHILMKAAILCNRINWTIN